MSNAKTGAPNLIAPRPARAAAAAPAAKTGPVKWYEVTSPDKTIRMQGAAEFVIRRGKTISSAEYDVELLKSRGVTLKDIAAPAWWVEAQEKGAAKHADLTAKGHPLGDLPEAPLAS